MSDGMVISFDVESARKIARMAGMSGLLRDYVSLALYDGADLLIEASKANMHWKNPTGALEDSMDILSDKPYEVILGSQLPYAWRREEGFYGADSLGRVYADQGAYFLSDAVDKYEDQIVRLINEAIENALIVITA